MMIMILIIMMLIKKMVSDCGSGLVGSGQWAADDDNYVDIRRLFQIVAVG